MIPSRPCRVMQGESEKNMLESRNSYGYGYVGSNEKGFEWLLIYGEHYHQRIKSGYVYKTERQALKEGNKFLEETVKKKWPKDYYDETKLNLSAVPSTPLHFGY